MGVDVYAIRAQHVKTDIGQVHFMTWVCRSSDLCDFYGDRNSRMAKMQCAKADAVWDKRGYLPRFVVQIGTSGQPRDGAPVVEQGLKGACWYDCDRLGKVVGYLRSQKRGRRTVWTVVPEVWYVTFGRAPHWIDEQRIVYSAAEALEAVQQIPEGLAWSEVEHFSAAPQTALERIDEPEAPEVAKIERVLLSGPWPVAMWRSAGLADTADKLVLANRVELVRDQATGELCYCLPNWADIAEAAETHLGAPRSAVDWDQTEAGIVCRVAGVGTFEGSTCQSVVLAIRRAGEAGRRFCLTFAATLKASDPRLYATLSDGDMVTFCGGQYGTHTLNLATRTEHEIRVHWDGYCDNNGAAAV